MRPSIGSLFAARFTDILCVVLEGEGDDNPLCLVLFECSWRTVTIPLNSHGWKLLS